MHPTPDPVAAAIEEWKDRLLDLSSRNPLLNFRPERNAFRLVLPDPDALLAQVLDAGAPPLRLASDATPGETGVVVGQSKGKSPGTVLRDLHQTSRGHLADQGVHTLTLAFGLLSWTSDDTAIDSPLLVLPVTLGREDVFSDYTLAPAHRNPQVVLNPALTTKIQREYQTDLEKDIDEDDLTPGAVIEIVRSRIANHFESWVVHDVAYLALLPYEKHALYEDIERRTDSLLTHPVIRAIGGDPAARKPPAPSGTGDTAPAWQVLDADQSQRDAIQAVNTGESLIIQGPPGTGKSQTITNLVAESLGRGKTVLFVSEKQAALRVVSSRLAQAGLGEFCLEAHDEALDEAAVVRGLAATSGMGIPMARTVPDDIQRKALGADREELLRLRAEFDAYYRNLCDDVTPFGGSTYAVMGQLAHLADAPLVRFDYDPDATAGLTPSRLDDFKDTLEDLVATAPLVRDPSQSAWQHVNRDVVERNPATRFRLRERLRAFEDAIVALAEQELASCREWGLSPRSTRAGAVEIVSLLEACVPPTRSAIQPAWFRREGYDAATGMLARYDAEHLAIQALRDDVLTRYQTSVLDGDLTSRLQAELLVNHPGTLRLHPVFSPGASQTAPLQLPARFACALAIAAANETLVLGEQLTERFGLRPARTHAHLTRLQSLMELVERGMTPRRDWFVPDHLERLSMLAAQARDHARALARKDEFLRDFHPDIFDAANDDRIARLEDPDPGLISLIQGLFRLDLILVEQRATPPAYMTRSQAAVALREARAIRDAQEWFASQADALDTAFGHYDTGPSTDWDDVLVVLDIIRQGNDLLDPNDPPSALIDFPTQITPADTLSIDFVEALSRLDSAMALLESVKTAPLEQVAASMRTMPLEDLANHLIANHIGGYDALIAAAAGLSAARIAPWTTFEDLTRDLRDCTTITAFDTALGEAFGPHFQGVATDWATIRSSLEWIGRIHTWFGIEDPPQSLVRHIVDMPHLAGASAGILRARLAEFDDARTRLAPFFIEEPAFDENAIATRPLGAIAAHVHDLRDDLAGLDAWLTSRNALNEAERLGMLPFVNAVRARPEISAERWTDAFNVQIRTLWLTWRLGTAPALDEFIQSRPDALRERLVELDRAQLSANAERLIADLRARLDRALGDTSYVSDIATLRQLANGAAGNALRLACTQVSNLLPELKPCFLMSPMSVARLLGDSNMRFDVVIFDEASQILPEDAIGSIGRGTQLVVVGDSQQLPPATFFQAAADEGEWRPGSLLDACATVAGLPATWLLWHYRSRHEDLIAFANREFYNNQLVTFPAANHGVDPIEFQLVPNAVYGRDGATNPVEARALVDAVIQQVERDPHSSTGIITFSKAQMDTVQQELDTRVKARPDLATLLGGDGPEGLFVRNLENVQGDERDVIFMSVGYGPNQGGTVVHRFGPLTNQGGDRRLNVAVTRARQRMVVLASFEPHAIRSARSEGMQKLHDYLVFAQQPASEPRHPGRETRIDHAGFADAVATALARAGLHVVRDVGVGQCRIDIALRDSGDSDSYLLGILCDGSQYQTARDARDRERLRPQVLGALGWNLHQVWSLAWLRDPDHEVKQILDKAARLRSGRGIADPAPMAPRSPAASPLDLVKPTTPDAFTVHWEPGGGTEPTTPPVPVSTAPAPPPTSEPEPKPPVSTSPPPVESEPEPPVSTSPPTLEPEPEPPVTTPAGPVPAAPTPPPDSTPPPTRKPRKARSRKPPAAQTEPDAPAVPSPTPVRAPQASKLDQPISDIKGLTARAKRALVEADILTIGALLDETGTDQQLRALARKLKTDPAVLRDWANRADLMRITGIGTQFADLLELSGVASCRELRQRRPDNLLATLTAQNAEHSITKRLPTLDMVTGWIAQAKQIVASTPDGA